MSKTKKRKKESKVIPINKIPDDLPPYISRKILENFIMPANTMEYEPDEDMVDVPILGRIATGLPLDAVENYLFRNDYIDEVELQRNVKNLVDTKKLLENQLQENNGDKINEQKRKRILDMLNTGNIREMNYEQQKKIVKSCISKILLTSEEITIEFNF